MNGQWHPQYCPNEVLGPVGWYAVKNEEMAPTNDGPRWGLLWGPLCSHLKDPFATEADCQKWCDAENAKNK